MYTEHRTLCEFRDETVQKRSPVTAILGISAYYHDSAAALVVDGRLVAAAQEERFSRRKHDASFPTRAIEYCLREAGLTIGEVDQIGFYERPMTKFDRLLETHLATAPAHPKSFRTVMGPWLSWKLRMASRIRRELSLPRHHPLHFCDHHRSHARSALNASPFSSAAIVTIDSVGEWTTTTIASGDHGRITPRMHLDFPHSLGLLYSACTAFAGFRVNDGEYKLMGLAPLGTPRYVSLIFERMVTLCDDGSFRLHLDLFDFSGSESMLTDRFGALFGAKPRRAGEPIRELDRDLAASIQQVTETIMLRIARHARQLTGHDQLCLAGGVALNCSATGRLLQEGVFDHVWVQPAAGDAGGAIGAALELDRQCRGPVSDTDQDAKCRFDNLLGPSYDDDAIGRCLQESGVCFETLEEERLCQRTAGMIAAGKIVGWFQGRMEFGPRALGARSILADPRNRSMQQTLNLKTKFRESFRPFAPVVLRDRAADWFEMGSDDDSPFMTFVFPVREDKRSQLPAVTHVDGTARVQTVDRTDGTRWSRLLEAFEHHTGTPVLINTSFNVADEPIVCSPLDALRCFFATHLDALVVGKHLVVKEDQSAGVKLVAANASPPPSTLWQRFSEATAPVRQRVEAAIIIAFYYAVITPFGWTLRCFGYDPLRSRPLTSASAWITTPRASETGPREASRRAPRFGLLGEFLQFLREEKKWWLAPLLLMIGLLSLLVAVSASPVAPFIYTLF